MTVVNGKENNVDFQNENNIKISMMSNKTYRRQNVFKENEKITLMIIITKTISLCLYKLTVSCIYHRSQGRFSAESVLNRLLNTSRPIIRIHISNPDFKLMSGHRNRMNNLHAYVPEIK